MRWYVFALYMLPRYLSGKELLQATGWMQRSDQTLLDEIELLPAMA